MDRLWQDTRFAFRSFTRDPVFTLTIVVIIALGIGATTSIFSVVDGVVLKALPLPDPDRLVYFDEGSHTVVDYRMWEERAPSFQRIAAVWPEEKDMLGEGPPARVGVMGVTAGYFPLLGGTPFRGRLVTAADTRGPRRVVVLSYWFWTSRFGGDESVVGRSLRLDNEAYEVVGIAAPGFHPPRRISRRAIDMWRPVDLTLADLQREDRYSLSVFGRLRDGATIDAAQSEVDASLEILAARYPGQYESPSGWKRIVPLITLHEAEVGETRVPLFLLLGAVGLMLLIACANVANLFLARGTTRQREIAVRAALGASRGRIVSQLLTESVLLSVVGGIAGVGIAFLGVHAFLAAVPPEVPRIDQVMVDSRVLFFAVSASLITGVAFGLAPAVYAARTDVNKGLKEGSSKSSAGRPHLRLKGALVVTEIALALMLLVGAGLLFNSFVRLTLVDPGFVPDNVLAIELSLESGYESDQARRQFARDALDRVLAVPGVTTAATGWIAPFSQRGRCCWMSLAKARTGLDSTSVVMHPVSPGYFETLGVPVVQGRDFDWTDDDTEPAPVIITRTLSERFFPDGEALGETFTVGRRSPATFRVIGIVNDLKYWSLSRDKDRDVFLAYEGYGPAQPLLTLAVKTTGVLDGTDQLRQAIWSIDPDLPIPEILSLTDRVAESIATPRLMSILLLTFAGFGIVLAAGGIYATMLYAVSQRSHELGIRLALGASAGQLLRHVLKGGAVLAGIGLAIGLAGAYAASRVMASLVFGITTQDLPTYGAVTLLLGVIAMVACYLPARRAARLDPMATLRME